MNKDKFFLVRNPNLTQQPNLNVNLKNSLCKFCVCVKRKETDEFSSIRRRRQRPNKEKEFCRILDFLGFVSTEKKKKQKKKIIRPLRILSSSSMCVFKQKRNRFYKFWFWLLFGILVSLKKNNAAKVHTHTQREIGRQQNKEWNYRINIH